MLQGQAGTSRAHLKGGKAWKVNPLFFSKALRKSNFEQPATGDENSEMLPSVRHTVAVTKEQPQLPNPPLQPLLEASAPESTGSQLSERGVLLGMSQLPLRGHVLV